MKKTSTFGIIHIGSIHTSMAIVKYHSPTQIEVIDSANKELPLGEEVFRTHRLSFASIHALSTILQGFRQLLLDYRVSEVYPIATTVVRAAENRLVAGTGNRSEIHMGYFTKWGDGASDFDVIADLTATEVFEFLEYLNAPRCIIDKAPSAGLFDGQTDEQEMGVTYKAIDDFLLYGTVNAQDKAVIDRYHNRSEHKRKPLVTYKGKG